MNCPDCGYKIIGNICVCGFKIKEEKKVTDPNHHLCAYIHSNGTRCQMPGTMAKDIARPDETTRFYCTWHAFYPNYKKDLKKFKEINPFGLKGEKIYRAWDIVNGVHEIDKDNEDRYCVK